MSPPAGLLKCMIDSMGASDDGRKCSVADYEWLIGASADDASALDAICSLVAYDATRQPEEMYTILLAVATAAGPTAALRFALTLLRSYLSWSRKVCSTVALTIQIAGKLRAGADADCESRMREITHEVVFRYNPDPMWCAAIRSAQLVCWASPEAENAQFIRWFAGGYNFHRAVKSDSTACTQVLQYLAANAWPGDVRSCVDCEQVVDQIMAAMRTPVVDVSALEVFARMLQKEN